MAEAVKIGLEDGVDIFLTMRHKNDAEVVVQELIYQVLEIPLVVRDTMEELIPLPSMVMLLVEKLMMPPGLEVLEL